jgi:hypothetical protein
MEELIPVDGKLMVAIRVLAYEGIALRVASSIRGDTFQYVAASSWLGEPIAEREADDSLQWLAAEYLRAFGPVRPDDFAWWAGVTKTRARKMVGQLETVDVGYGLLLLEADEDDFWHIDVLEDDEIAILPKWDPYTMGYPAGSRTRFLDDAHLDMAYPKVRATRGDGAPLILRNGRAVATWGHRFSGDRMSISVTPFDPTDRMTWLDHTHFEGVAGLLGATDLVLTINTE